MRCEIVKDLLPLYCDDTLSDVSKEEVEKHIAACDDCKMTYEEMKGGDIKLDFNLQNIEPLKKVRKKIKITKVIITALSAVFLLLGVAYELLCAHPMLASYKDISFSPSVTRVDVYRYFDDTQNISKEIQLPNNCDLNVDTDSDIVYVNGKKLLDENGKTVPATGQLYPIGSFRIYIHVSNKLMSLKYRIDQSYTDNAVSAKIEFRPCLPFRQNIDELTEENGLMWSAPLRDISENSKLIIHCRDGDITLDLYNLINDTE